MQIKFYVFLFVVGTDIADVLREQVKHINVGSNAFEKNLKKRKKKSTNKNTFVPSTQNCEHCILATLSFENIVHVLEYLLYVLTHK